MGNKKAKNVLLAMMGALIIIETVARMLTIQKDTVVGIGLLISLLFTALYGFWLYKKPHGNMLKYAMLLCAFVTILSGAYFVLDGYAYQIPKIVASAALCYCAGRLNRIDQNKYIMPVIGLVYLAVSIYAARLNFANQAATVLGVLKVFTFTIDYFVLMIAYFVRFEEHKLAGIMDAPKN